MRTLFISDLHLSPQLPQLTNAFIEFLNTEAAHADALYILGDLFDFWIGDDDPSQFAESIRIALKSLTSRGVKCYFIHGNRDFLVGRRFAKDTGIGLLSEETKVTLAHHRCVLLHGDTLCLKDVRYLAFRAKVQQPWLQWVFKRLPFKLRTKIVAQVQSGARNDKSNKALDIMDVTPSEVINIMAKHDATIMIHGHTHKPTIEQISTENQNKVRIVLGDWGEKLYYLDFKDTEYQLVEQVIKP
jgi:UDP-2,3-diacylglucosamine hydrolase